MLYNSEIEQDFYFSRFLRKKFDIRKAAPLKKGENHQLYVDAKPGLMRWGLDSLSCQQITKLCLCDFIIEQVCKQTDILQG